MSTRVHSTISQTAIIFFIDDIFLFLLYETAKVVVIDRNLSMLIYKAFIANDLISMVTNVQNLLFAG